MNPIRRRQYLYAGILGCAGLSLIGILVWSTDGKTPISAAPTKETNITTAGQRINPQEIWVERLEGENKITQQKLDALEKLMAANTKMAGEAGDKAERLAQELEEFRGQKNLENLQAPSDSKNSQPFLKGAPESFDSSQALDASGIKKIVLNLSGTGPHVKKQDQAALENTLPAGTFAKAVLLGGVDASTAISAPSDPRPVLLRITDKGTLPRKFSSNLKDCHILASSYGDLSSERVYMRLEKLTCTEHLTGEISETVVAGYVVGEDGKAGVRGVVADKAGPIVRNSLLGGFFSGIGKFFEGHHNQASFPATPLSVVDPLNAKQIFSAGTASGTSHALEKYAEFFIKRAEQLQPVLQVAAGREVDIVFTQGTRFGETSVRKTLTKIREKSRAQAIQSLEARRSNWLPETPKGDE